MSEPTFAPLVSATKTALAAAPPSGGVVTFRAESAQEAGLRSVVRIRDFAVEVDEPEALGGTDTAPNPVELVLAALATCQEITYRLYADHLGISLDTVSVTVEGDVDLRGLFGVGPRARPGFTAIRGTVQLGSSASPVELARLKAEVDAHCPVLDLVSNRTPTVLALTDAIPA